MTNGFFVVLKGFYMTMNIKYILVVLCGLILGSELSAGQGTLVFLNGKERRFETAEVRGEYIVYRPEGKSGAWLKRADKYNVFAIVSDSTGEKVVYEPDTSEGGDPTIQEVRDYIKGEQHAAKVYRKPMNFVGGFLSGAAGSAAGFYGIPAPLVYTTIVGRINPKLPKDERNENYSEMFVLGYQKKARNMKIKNSLIGGVIGFGVGITTLVLILGND